MQVFDTAEQELAATGQPSSSRGCKYALNTLMQTFQLKAMAANVAAGPVRGLTSAQLLRIVMLCTVCMPLVRKTTFLRHHVDIVGKLYAMQLNRTECSESHETYQVTHFAKQHSIVCLTCPFSLCVQLRECAAVLLMKLLDDQVPALMEGTQLLKALNVLMLKILDNCSRYLMRTYAVQGLSLNSRASLIMSTSDSARHRNAADNLCFSCALQLTLHMTILPM